MRSVSRASIFALLVSGFTAVGMAQYSSPVRDVENPAHAPFWLGQTVTVTPTHLTRLYSQIDTAGVLSMSFSVERSNSTATLSCNVSLSGYTVNFQ